MGIDRAVGAQPAKGWQHLDDVPKRVHRPPAEIFKAEAVAFLAVPEERLIARHIARREPCHLGAHPGVIARDLKARAVGPANLVIGVERGERHVLVEIAPAIGPELAQHLRNGDDRRPQIEAVAVAMHGRATPAGHIQPVDKGHVIAARAQPHGRGKATQPRADHHGAAGARGDDAPHVFGTGRIVKHGKPHNRIVATLEVSSLLDNCSLSSRGGSKIFSFPCKPVRQT
jgi:hypothetical protein